MKKALILMAFLFFSLTDGVEASEDFDYIVCSGASGQRECYKAREIEWLMPLGRPCIIISGQLVEVAGKQISEKMPTVERKICGQWTIEKVEK